MFTQEDILMLNEYFNHARKNIASELMQDEAFLASAIQYRQNLVAKMGEANKIIEDLKKQVEKLTPKK